MVSPFVCEHVCAKHILNPGSTVAPSLDHKISLFALTTTPPGPSVPEYFVKPIANQSNLLSVLNAG